jgi:integrase
MGKKDRRGHNEGSIYYDASKDRWVVEVTIETGQRKKFRFKTKQEAVRKKNEALREIEQGTIATGSQRRLGECLEDWLENTHKSKLRLGTYINYKKLVGYVIAELGNV